VTFCANENGNCQCQGTVYYGADGAFRSKIANGNIGCNSHEFGDASPGKVKSCYCSHDPSRQLFPKVETSKMSPLTDDEGPRNEAPSGFLI
jgi:hypothetical protein